jgi:hypothetical protein
MNRRDAIDIAKNRSDTRINLCLCAAEAAFISGDYEDAERMYTRGLRWSEERYGTQSAAVGLVLLSLVDLYEKDGKNRSTSHFHYRINSIFRKYYFQWLCTQMDAAVNEGAPTDATTSS